MIAVAAMISFLLIVGGALTQFKIAIIKMVVLVWALVNQTDKILAPQSQDCNITLKASVSLQNRIYNSLVKLEVDKQ